MNIKIKIFICLLLNIIPFIILPTAKTLDIQTNVMELAAPVHSKYLPILNYQNSLLDMITRLLTQFLYKESQVQEIIRIAIKQNTIKSREQALAEIKQATTKLFDHNDPHHISVHLETMKDLSQYLDREIDQKTISAIHFLLDNQHRSSLLDTLFWVKAVKDMELNTVIPMTLETANKSKVEKLAILRKKMATAPKTKITT